jgi:prepilin-type N-terminal cleavage/methylation domain-containing protein
MKKAFTLVELLVVISIIALLLAIIVPSMNKARETAKRIICSNQIKEVARGVAMYADVYDNQMPFYGGYDPSFTNLDPPLHRYACKEGDATCPKGGIDEEHPYAVFRQNPLWCPEEDTSKPPWPMKLGCLYAKGVITDARVFYCPSNKEGQYLYNSYTKPQPPNTSLQWGTLPQQFNTDYVMNQWVRTGYTYFPVDGTIPKRNFGVSLSDLLAPRCTARRFDKLDPRISYLADVLWFRKTMSHKTKDTLGVNAAFKDTHVVYCNDWRLFKDNPTSEDPTERLWNQWDPYNIDGSDNSDFTGKVKFNFFYYNLLKKIQP